jgi:hypothetical protein
MYKGVHCQQGKQDLFPITICFPRFSFLPPLHPSLLFSFSLRVTSKSVPLVVYKSLHERLNHTSRRDSCCFPINEPEGTLGKRIACSSNSNSDCNILKSFCLYLFMYAEIFEQVATQLYVVEWPPMGIESLLFRA